MSEQIDTQDGYWYLCQVSRNEDVGTTISAINVLSKLEHEQLSEARKSINAYLGSKNVGMSVHANKEDLLRAVVNLATSYRQATSPVEELMIAGSADISRHLANLCSLFRSFIDHYTGYFRRNFGRKSSEFLNWSEFSSLADRSRGYNLIYHIRNYIQHYDMPALNVSITESYDSEGFNLSVLLDFEQFRKDRDLARNADSGFLEGDGASLFLVLDEWSRCFQEVEAYATRQRALALASSAKYISGLREKYGVGDSGKIAVIWLPHRTEKPENLSLEIAYFPENAAIEILKALS